MTKPNANMHRMNLARFRDLRQLRQVDLAEMIGVDKATISRAENMHPSARLETYQKCADVLGVTLQDIFCEELTPVKRELVAMIRSVPDEKLSPIAALLQMAIAGDPAVR